MPQLKQHMKKIVLLLAVFSTYGYSTKAQQCVPSTCTQISAIKPYCHEAEFGTDMRTAGVGEAYSGEIKINIATGGGVFPATYTVNQATITSITGLPNSFSWVSSSGATIPGGGSTCITISGTAGILDIGPRPFVINLSISTSLTTIPAILNYTLNVSLTSSSITLTPSNLFSIAPNPTIEDITVVSPVDNASLSLYDLSGRLILTNTLNTAGATNVSLKELQAGLYIAKVLAKDGSVMYTQKIIKEN